MKITKKHIGGYDLENGWRIRWFYQCTHLRLFVHPETIPHRYVVIRERGGRWMIVEVGNVGDDEPRVAGPFPCRKVAVAAWRVIHP